MEVIKDILVNRIDCDLQFGEIKCHTLIKNLFGNFDPDYPDFPLIIQAVYDLISDKIVVDFEKVLRGFEHMKLNVSLALKFISIHFTEYPEIINYHLLNEQQNEFIKKYHQILNYEIGTNFLTISSKNHKGVFARKVVEAFGIEFTYYYTKSIDNTEDYGYWVSYKFPSEEKHSVIVSATIYDLEILEAKTVYFNSKHQILHQDYGYEDFEPESFELISKDRLGIVSYQDSTEIMVEFKFTLVT